MKAGLTVTFCGKEIMSVKMKNGGKEVGTEGLK